MTFKNCSIFLLFLILFSFFFRHPVFAASNTVQGTVKLSDGTSVDDAIIEVRDVTNNTLILSTTSDNNGFYSLTVESGTYTIEVIPPQGSNLNLAVSSNRIILSDKTINFTFASAGKIALSGVLYDSLKNTVVNQRVWLQASGSATYSTQTDEFGFYYLEVSTAGLYSLNVASPVLGNNLAVNLPVHYSISTPGDSYLLTRNTTLDIDIPVKKVTVQTQDLIGNNSLGGMEITVSTTPPGGSFSGGDLVFIGDGVLAAGGYSYYNFGPITDSITGNAILWLFPNNSNYRYNITATPSTNDYVATTKTNVFIENDTQVSISMQQQVTLDGYIYDPLGNPASNQRVRVQSAGAPMYTAITNDSGYYSLQVATGIYTLLIQSPIIGNSLFLNLPEHYSLISAEDNLILYQNTTINFTIPAKKVIVQVRNALQSPLGGIEIKAETSVAGVSFSGGLGFPIANDIYAVGGYSYYSSGIPNDPISGNATIWLLPNNSIYRYNLIAAPLITGNYVSTTKSNVLVNDNQNETIYMQYSHNAPVTTISFTPGAYLDGTYPEPVSVTLTANAASGYNIGNVYYKVDGGIQQIYSTPFLISGIGNHTITYWTIDNTGIQEIPNIKTLYTQTNLPPVINSLSNVVINQGSTFTTNGSFSDLDSSSWTATVDYGDGSGTQNLNLNDTTFILNHMYNTLGSYLVVIAVTDDKGNSENVSFTVDVQRQLVSLNPAHVWVGIGAKKNAGIKFDLQTQLYLNGVLISTGQINSVSGGTSQQFSGALLNAIPFSIFVPVSAPFGSTLNIRFFVRNACIGSTKASGSAKLWYNSTNANSRFGAIIGFDNNTYYLGNNNNLLINPGISISSTTVSVGAQCGPFVQLGTWSTTI